MEEKQKKKTHEKNSKNVKAKENVNTKKKTKKKKKNGIVNKENVQSDKPCKSVSPKKKKAKSKTQPQKNTAQKAAQQSKSKKKKKQKQSKNSFLLRQLEDVSECKHAVLRDCYRQAGFGVFVGQVTRVEEKRVFFKHLSVQWEDGGNPSNGFEDDIWVYDTKSFEDNQIGQKDMVGFDAEVFVYKKRGAKKLGIRNLKNVTKLPPLDTPAEELATLILKQNYREIPQWLKCETCLFSDHCDRIVCVNGDC